MNKKKIDLSGSKSYYLAGIIAPFVFIFTAVLGGLLRPGYSHMSNTISELFSPGSPNKVLLDILHSSYAVLLIIFGIGLLQFTSNHRASSPRAVIASWLYLVMAIMSLTTATIFPQDPWGAIPTFPGEMHKIVSGILSVIALISMALIASWFKSSGEWTAFLPFTSTIIILTVSAVLALYFYIDTPIMGLVERLTILPGFTWNLILAVWLFQGKAAK